MWTIKKQFTPWLPTTRDEMKRLGWHEVDVILITGDAYVDHPSFGVAIIARLLDAWGLKVGVIPQPNWQDDGRDFKKLGKPRLFFGVTAGNVDSMVNHYTARKRIRSNDDYTPGGRKGLRPDYASYVYVKKIKTFYPDSYVILGGIEASCRRFIHYDYWSDMLKPSIMVETGADLLIYGMAEKSLWFVTQAFLEGKRPETLAIPGTTILANSYPTNYEVLPSYEDCVNDPRKFVAHFLKIEQHTSTWSKKGLVEPYGEKYVVTHPPMTPLTEKEMDYIYSLPFQRQPHPRYKKKPPIPAFEMIKNSITLHRGCFGGCSFCSIAMHQGKFIQSRSKDSVIEEVNKLIQMPYFKGTITDLGGPSANMYQMHPNNIELCKKCKRVSCIHPKVCQNLSNNMNELLDLYGAVSSIPGVKHVFISSGIRYDLFLHRDGFVKGGKKYFEQLVERHTSGRLKVAPEFSDEKTLKLMRKPSFELFKKLVKEFRKVNHRHFQINPYLISSHPGSDEQSHLRLKKELEQLRIFPEQVQDFTPTPLTLSSVMFYSEVDPYTGERIKVIKDAEIKRKLQYLLVTEKKM
ncbi:MAG: YgiQ family radical SAM protein [Bacteroidales bacterium]|nr:YgiQ family radical SAM protein [Bacteroidales bacterium]